MAELPKYRFMPWCRQGLAAHTQNDDKGGKLPARAPLSVAITVSGATAPPPVELRLYGPGDVIGIDSRVIVRTDPRAHTTNSEPNYLAAIEFDLPDLPWMFTPAKAGPTDQRLRPWCVLIVLDKAKVAAPKVNKGAPLPSISIPAAAAKTELPNLDESWAWAHVQALSGSGDPATLAAELASAPHLNVSRLLCPRRLEPNKHYYACLVPAFDLGVQRGLGAIPSGSDAQPAWDLAQNKDVTLPVYFHWEFGTGPAGNFESLARKLTPMKASGAIGFQRMFIGEPRGGLPAANPVTEKDYTLMEGVLRAPEAESSDLKQIPEALQTGIQQAVNTSKRPGANQPGGVLTPPLYGEWHLNRHRIDAASPAWLRELNLDPRMRAAAGLGAEVVRRHQEDFMQACWEQVGEVIQANALLNRSRFSQEALQRIYERHYKPLSEERLLQVTEPMHGRVPLGDLTVRGSIARASLPNAGVDSALRRLTSPQRSWLKRVARRARSAPLASRSARLNLTSKLATGKLSVDPTQFTPDGLTGVALLETVAQPPSNATEVDLSPLEIQAKLSKAGLQTFLMLRTTLNAIKKQELPPLQLRPQIATLGFTLSLGGFAGPRAAAVSAPVSAGPVAGASTTGRPHFPVPPPSAPASNRYQIAFNQMASAARIGMVERQPVFVEFKMAATRTALLQRMDPSVMVPRRVRDMLSVEGSASFETIPGIIVSKQLDRVMVAPEIDAPMYSYLARYDPERFMPGVGKLPADSIMLVETNPRFIEAFMVGLNYEMSREMLWRGYPTDQRGTVMKHFWDWASGDPDLKEPIHKWLPKPLGAHVRGAGQDGQIVLLLRGQLLRRYPNTVIRAWRAQNGRLKASPGVGDIKEPVFRGQFDPDVSFAGFDLTKDMLTQDDGWFFVFEEQLTEPRFGFDETSDKKADQVVKAADLAWPHTQIAPGGHLVLAISPLKNKPLETVQFGKNSAHLANITLQKPMRVAIHGKHMLKV